MPSGANRLGFFYKRTTRSYKRRILCFYDPLTNGPGGDTDYYSGPDRKPDTDLYPPVAARITALGYIPTLVQTYSDLLNLDLQIYSQIWDLGYASPYITNPNNPTDKILNYLKGGGALFLLGENSSFQPRDNAIGTFIEAAGGGLISEGSVDYNYSRELTINSGFLKSNLDNAVTFSRPGTFTSIGLGTAMTTAPFPLSGSIEYPAVSWITGNLTNSPLGMVTSVLDLNFIVGIYQNNNFIDNIIESLNNL